ncbi:hisA/hisF family protein [Ferroglobus placidus DSM 10642]|uniref:HisA/hisF family protein n=1 Tax=Ferroglobus placidus (strain DSM 10642 / AEDII12DO) TaxID=589924 RepID=D3S2M1_FERPA|nr:HisA/HisF family protein [Ferroglobus placidus]ADC64551.1 hisA/hisF family protein [Ferroglobus placidus DSM 10642]
MKVYLAVDVKSGLVVWGKSGKRSEYVPIERVSKVVRNSNLKEFFEELKVKRAYVADLDRIEGRGSNLEVIDEIGRKVELIVDGGFKSVEEALNRNFTPIFATETFDVRKLEGFESCMVSVDVKEKLLDASKSFGSLEELLEYLNSLKLKAVIILPIHSVGTYSFDFSLLEKALDILNHKIITGGGLKPEDLDVVKEMGIYGVIVGTAFHQGKIDPEIVLRGEF